MSDQCLRHRGFTLIGLIVTIGIIAVLLAIVMTSMKNATGAGGTGSGVQKNQISTHVDRTNLYNIYRSIQSHTLMNQGMPIPTEIAHSSDKSLDTTANFWSALIAQGYASPDQLISENENSDYVWVDDDYNRSYSPVSGDVPWDTSFAADLHQLSNVSYAHVPLYGERLRQWANGGSTVPIIGNRGPQDGTADPNSWTTDDTTGAWAGNVAFADGHVEFFYTPTVRGDNIFAMESGQSGSDGILGFTKEIWNGGFDLQWD